MSYTSITHNWENKNSLESVKNYIHENIKCPDSSNTRPKQIYCRDWGKYTESIQLIIMSKYNTYVFAIFSICNKCKKFKQCSISNEHYEKFPSY